MKWLLAIAAVGIFAGIATASLNAPPTPGLAADTVQILDGPETIYAVTYHQAGQKWTRIYRGPSAFKDMSIDLHLFYQGENADR